ncbi:MAG: type II toxin-antitoxin system VapC family toxin [Rhodomicrobium sp.]
MKLLLDTHALIWWFEGNQSFSPRVRKLIEERQREIAVSAISAWEIATKVRKGKLAEARELIENFEDFLREQEFIPLPVTMAHAKLGGSLASPHKDPFDRLIAAQAQAEDVPVATCDPAFQTLGVRIFW